MCPYQLLSICLGDYKHGGLEKSITVRYLFIKKGGLEEGVLVTVNNLILFVVMVYGANPGIAPCLDPWALPT